MKNRIFRNSIIFTCAMTLLCCTSSTQATRAMQIGGAMVGFGSAIFLTGYATRNDGSTFLMPLGGVISSAGFWPLVIGAVTRPSLIRIESLNPQLRQGQVVPRIAPTSLPSIP